MINVDILIWHTWFVDIPQTKIMHFTSNDTKWEDLPRDGMLGAVFISETKEGERHQKWNFNTYDYYFKADGINGPIYACDIQQREINTIEDINKRYKNASIIRGIWTDETTMLYVQSEIRSIE